MSWISVEVNESDEYKRESMCMVEMDRHYNNPSQNITAEVISSRLNGFDARQSDIHAWTIKKFTSINKRTLLLAGVVLVCESSKKTSSFIRWIIYMWASAKFNNRGVEIQ